MQVPIAAATAGENVEEIPDKLYFRIGEVSRLVGVKPHVLRYWESEFPSIAPRKAGSNHRLYRRKDVEALLEIKRLLYDKRFTIAGARKALAAWQQPEQPRPRRRNRQGQLFASKADIGAIRRELREILKLLK